MIEVFITKEVLPDGLKLSDIDEHYLTLNFRGGGIFNMPFFVKKGDPIVDLYFNKSRKSSTKTIDSPCDGVIERSYNKIEPGGLFYRILSEKEYIDSVNSSFTLIEDEITGEKRINWKNENGLLIGSERKVEISFNLCYGWPTLYLRLYKMGKPRKGDTIYLLFDNKKVLSYLINDNVESSGFCAEVALKLSQEDLEIMSSRSFIKVRIDYKDKVGVNVIEISNQQAYLTEYIGSELFKKYVNSFISALKEAGFKWPEKVRNISQGQGGFVEGDPCYVYLMVDTTNGFHKIGISNNPEYREATLQSEKPTIELICAKQYPTRLIASAIESALHTAFGDKRLRGEWFELSEQDVNSIILTLK